MNDNLDWRGEMDKARSELGSPGLLGAYWLGTAVVLYLFALLAGGGLPGVFNTIIILVAAIPFALGVGWLTARRKKR